jgi:POT family proton-dependent oligopeptide transporter
MRYYLLINVGALTGQISMVYAEKYVGFWLAYLLPTILFIFCPLLMVGLSSRYVKKPPQGDVLVKSMKLYGFAMKGRWSLNPVREHGGSGFLGQGQAEQPVAQARLDDVQRCLGG